MTPEQREELAACPFCGEMPKLVDMAGWEIVCQCGINLCLATATIAPLVTAWNRRAQVEALTVPQWISVGEKKDANS